MGNPGLVSNSKRTATFSLIIGVVMSVIGSSFQYGYNIAVMNAPKSDIQDFFFDCNSTENFDPNEKDNCSVSYKNYRDNMYAVAVAVFAFSGMVGSLLVGAFVNKFGRRGGLLVNNVFSLLGAIFLGVSKTANSFALIIIGRFFIGVFSGLATGLIPMYIGEISPKEWRGAIGITNQLLITIGILVAQVFGLEQLLGTPDLWPVMFALTFIPSLLQSIAIPFMPKSPRYLLIDLKQEDAARNELVKLRGVGDVSAEMDEMREEAEAESQTQAMSIGQLINERSVRWQLITILAMMVAQQLSGINAVFFYTNTIFDRAGIPKGNPQGLAAVGVGTVNVLMTVVAAGIIERVGRKKLLVYGFGAMVFWCLVLTIILNLLIGLTADGSTHWLSYLSIICVIGYIVGFAVGPGPIPWIMNAEFFTQAARPPATMLSCVANWTCNFLIGIGFPAVANAAGPYVFLGFMIVSLLITIYLQIVMPETKNKTFAEINALFAKRNGIIIQEGEKVALNPVYARTNVV